MCLICVRKSRKSNKKLVDRLDNYQSKYYSIVDDFFENATIAFEICLFLGIIPGFECIKRPHDQYKIYCSILSSTNKFFITGSSDCTLKIWDVESGKCIQILEGHSDAIDCCVVSSDDTFLISGSSDNSLKVWNIQNGKYLHTLEGHKSNIECCILSSDNRFVISGSFDATLKSWDVQNGKNVHTFEGHIQTVNDCVLSRNNSILISCSDDKMLKIWDFHDEICLRTLEGHESEILTIQEHYETRLNDLERECKAIHDIRFC